VAFPPCFFLEIVSASVVFVGGVVRGFGLFLRLFEGTIQSKKNIAAQFKSSHSDFEQQQLFADLQQRTVLIWRQRYALYLPQPQSGPTSHPMSARRPDECLQLVA
jgi:hypothetical protein